jgi:hypothetical protein
MTSATRSIPLHNQLNRIQTELSRLLELERLWPNDVDVAVLKQVIVRKEDILSNLEALLKDFSAQEKKDPANKEWKAAREQVQSVMSHILELHQKNLETLKIEQDRLERALQECQQQRYLLDQLKSMNVQPVHVDVRG